MKRLLFIAIGVLALAGCTQKKTFTVEGTVEGAADKTLCLYHKTLGGAVLMDSLRLDAEGAFSFEGEAPEAPDFYLLAIDNQVVNLSIDSTETISVKAKMPGMAAKRGRFGQLRENTPAGTAPAGAPAAGTGIGGQLQPDP